MKVAIYTRVSTQMQVEKGISLDAQENELIEYCNRNNYKYVVFAEKGVSGKSIDKREKLQELLSRLNEFDIVLCYKLSRISRSVADMANMLKLFEETKTKFIAIKDGIDTSNKITGKLVVYIMSVCAEIERDNISEWVSMSKKQEFEEGKATVKAILGYDVINKMLKLNKKEAKIINFIFITYDKIRNYYQVAQICNNKGFRGKNGNLFHASSIKKIIQNITYCGYTVFHDQIRKSEHEAIIDLELFKKVNNIHNDEPLEKYYHISTKTITNVA